MNLDIYQSVVDFYIEPDLPVKQNHSYKNITWERIYLGYLCARINTQFLRPTVNVW